MALTADEALKVLQLRLTAPAESAAPPQPTAQPSPTTTTNVASGLNASQALEVLGSVVPAPTVQAPQAQQQPADRPSNLAETVFAPLTAVGSAAMTALRRPLLDTSDPSTRAQLGERPGIPFDISGSDPRAASFMDRMKESFTLNREEVAYALRAGNPNVTDVRFNTIGEPILTIKDPQSGEVRDILANPVGIDTGDFAFVLANAPALFAGGLAALGKNPSTLRNASRLAQWFLGSRSGVIPAAARSALAGQAVGTVEDLLSRGAMVAGGALPGVEGEEVVARHGVGVLTDFLFGSLVAAPAGKLTSRVITPVSQRGPIQMDAEAAARLWENVGVSYQLTPGQATGNAMLGRTEAFATQKPGSAGVFNTLEADQRRALDQMVRITLGTDPSAVPPADLVGRNALEAIGTRLQPIDAVIDRTTQDVLQLADTEIKQGVAATTRLPSNVATTSVGQRLFNGATARLEAFREQSRALYDAVFTHPAIAGRGRNIDATPLADDARRILGEVASVEQAGQTNPLTTFLDAGTRSKLEQLAGAQGGRIGLRDLIELRRDVDDDLFRGAALGGIPERRLSNIRDAITTRIETGLNDLDPSGALLTRWQAANEHYASNITRFKDIDILPIFKNAQQRGALDLYDIVNRATRDQGRWTAYRDFFGPDSDEMNHLRRAYADSLIGRTIGSDAIDMASFSNRLATAFEKQPDILNDVFGNRTRQLKAIADAGAAAAKGNINAADLARAIDDGSLTKTALNDLARLQEFRETTYRNKALDQLRKGEFRDSPSRLVDSLVFSRNAEVRDVQEVVSLLSDRPDVLDEIKQRTLLRVFHESTGGPEGKERIRAAALRHFLSDDPSGDMLSSRIRAVVGDDTMRLLQATHDITRPRDMVEGTFKSAGSISAGMAINELEKELLNPTGMVGTMGGILKSYLIASLYKTGPTRAWIGNNALGATGSVMDRAAFVNAFIAGAPVIADMAKIFTDDSEAGTAVQLKGQAARLAAIQLKNAIDADLRSGQQRVAAPQVQQPVQ